MSLGSTWLQELCLRDGEGRGVARPDLFVNRRGRHEVPVSEHHGEPGRCGDEEVHVGGADGCHGPSRLFPGCACPPMAQAAEGPDPRRFRRWHARIPGLAGQAGKAAGLLRRVSHDRRHLRRRPRCPTARGPRPMTATGRSGPARGSPSSPAWGPGRRACASSSGRNARTPARSCGSPGRA